MFTALRLRGYLVVIIEFDHSVTKTYIIIFAMLFKKKLYIQIEYFQDDIFPPTKQTNEPSMTNIQWFNSENIPMKKVSLKPENMKNCLLFLQYSFIIYKVLRTQVIKLI